MNLSKKTVSIFFLSTVVLFGSLQAQSTFIGVQGGLVNLSGGDNPNFTLQPTFGGSLSQHISDNWFADLSFSTQTLYDDTAASSSLSLGVDKDNATRKWKAMRFGLSLNRLLFSTESNFNISAGFGGGLLAWKIKDPAADTVYLVTSQKNQNVDYSASELFLSVQNGLHMGLSSRLSLIVQTRIDYLTGAGAEFNEATESARDKWQLASSLSLRFGLGGPKNISWQPTRVVTSGNTSPISYSSSTPNKNDSDNDGITDDKDKCPYNEIGVAVDKDGCPLDADYDGVGDDIDHCPNTDRSAAGMVDIYGCPVDSDFDGIPDYIDKCPHNAVGASVDSIGCPTDSDKDGVPDGLDDCPNTLYGVAVDKNGCIDIGVIDKPLVLYVDYSSGSHEVDPDTREKLKKLAALLNFVSDVKIEVNGYTDDIGTPLANRALSEKRARRVAEYLISYGVDAARIKVFGKGESDFIASNQTADGRAKNRRIEIVFYK
jgi:outer membrane protein OmpA-like peptidoglycan-associated protein